MQMECVCVSHYLWYQCQTRRHTYTRKRNPSTTYVMIQDKKATWVLGAMYTKQKLCIYNIKRLYEVYNQIS